MKVLFVVINSLLAIAVLAQPHHTEQEFLSRFKAQPALPEKLLSTRTVVGYSYFMTDAELKEIQGSFKKTGIDAVAYFKTDLLLAGKDVATAYSAYMNKRDVANLVFFQKSADEYKVFITTFNSKETFVEQDQNAWMAEDRVLTELLKKIYRAAGNLKNLNFLVNEFPEANLSVDIITGRRSDFFAIDMKVDQLAVPKFGNEEMDKELEEVFKSSYPLKYKLTEPGLSERDLRKQGNLFVLCYVYTRGTVARSVLGYDTGKNESAFVSVTYPNGEPQLKTIPAETPVYKFYFKHIDSGNVFLGTKWDADLTWQEALKNQLIGFKTELHID